MLKLTIGAGAFAVPGAEHRLGCGPELLHRIVGQRAVLFLDHFPVVCGEPFNRFPVKGRFALDAFGRDQSIEPTLK